MFYQILQRGAAPEGGGLVKFTCPCRQKLRPVQFLEPKKIKRIRGIAYPFDVCLECVCWLFLFFFFFFCVSSLFLWIWSACFKKQKLLPKLCMSRYVELGYYNTCLKYKHTHMGTQQVKQHLSVAKQLAVFLRNLTFTWCVSEVGFTCITITALIVFTSCAYALKLCYR